MALLNTAGVALRSQDGDPAECASLHFQSDYHRLAMIMALCVVY
jgi:hypothetical protein